MRSTGRINVLSFVLDCSEPTRTCTNMLDRTRATSSSPFHAASIGAAAVIECASGIFVGLLRSAADGDDGKGKKGKGKGRGKKRKAAEAVERA